MQNILSSNLLSKNIKIKTLHVILPLALYGCEVWSSTLREEHRYEVVREWGGEEDVWA